MRSTVNPADKRANAQCVRDQKFEGNAPRADPRFIDSLAQPYLGHATGVCEGRGQTKKARRGAGPFHIGPSSGRGRPADGGVRRAYLPNLPKNDS